MIRPSPRCPTPGGIRRVRRRASLRRALLLAAGVSLPTSACATSSFDRHFAARQWEEAARAFARDSSLHDSQRALYRAAIVHATPGTDAWDPARARELLERFLAREPRGSRALEASTMLALLGEVQDLRMREQVASRRLTDLARDVTMLEQHIAWIEERHAATEVEAVQLRELTANLSATLREREARMRALQQELDRLKEIDLNPARPPPTGNGGGGPGGSSSGILGTGGAPSPNPTRAAPVRRPATGSGSR